MLTITEWALARGIAQGMPLARLGAQYLDYASSRRTASALNLVQQKLVRLASHHCRPELAAALGSSMKDWPARSDTIMRALDRLTLLGEPKPTLGDCPEEWLPDGLAAKVARAGQFEDFAALVKRIEAGGYGWWRGLPRLGEKSARAIVAWLKARETALGVSLPPTAMVKPKRPRAPGWTRATGAGFGCGAGQGIARAISRWCRWSAFSIHSRTPSGRASMARPGKTVRQRPNCKSAPQTTLRPSSAGCGFTHLAIPIAPIARKPSVFCSGRCASAARPCRR